MKKNIKYLLLSIITMTIIYLPNVNAAATILDRDPISINGKQVKKLYVNELTGEELHTGTAGYIKLKVDGETKKGFCVDFGVAIDTGTAQVSGIEEYFKKGISEDKTKELVKTLTEYLKFGYGSEGKVTDKYYLATQKLIWEAISDTGYYATSYYDSINGSSLGKFKLKDFRWTTDGKTAIDLSNEINTIKTDIDNYYKKPSFCSSQEKLEIEVGETAEYTDNNGVLSNFEISCDDGIECSVEGNKLKVTAVNEAGSNSIKFSKTDTNPTNSYVYKGGQGVIVYSGTLEPVSCEFGIDTFKNEKTADTRMIYIITIGLFGGIMAYIAYYTKKSLEGLE